MHTAPFLVVCPPPPPAPGFDTQRSRWCARRDDGCFHFGRRAARTIFVSLKMVQSPNFDTIFDPQHKSLKMMPTLP